MSVLRRDVFPILGAGFAGARELLAANQPRVFSEAEYRLLDVLTERILPADETGPGAHDARVCFFIDTVLHYRTEQERVRWRNGLAGIDEQAKSRFGSAFADCAADQQHALLTQITEHEEPSSFFAELKRMTIEAFYLSDRVQREHLGYRGNRAVAEFSGCGE